MQTPMRYLALLARNNAHQIIIIVFAIGDCSNCFTIGKNGFNSLVKSCKTAKLAFFTSLFDTHLNKRVREKSRPIAVLCPWIDP